MFDETKHKILITPNDEMDLSQKNKSKLESWRKTWAKNKKTCDVLRFVPNRKQFYEGGVRGVMWPGSQEWDMTNGRNKVTPSDPYVITKDGYCPQTEQEAIRLLFLSQDPQNKICLYEDRELGNEARASVIESQRLKAENERMKEEMEELRRKLADRGQH